MGFYGAQVGFYGNFWFSTHLSTGQKVFKNSQTTSKQRLLWRYQPLTHDNLETLFTRPGAKKNIAEKYFFKEKGKN